MSECKNIDGDIQPNIALKLVDRDTGVEWVDYNAFSGTSMEVEASLNFLRVNYCYL